MEMLDKAQKPVVIGDVELIRFKLQKEFAGFLDKTGFPYVTMMLGKTRPFRATPAIHRSL